MLGYLEECCRDCPCRLPLPAAGITTAANSFSRPSATLELAVPPLADPRPGIAAAAEGTCSPAASLRLRSRCCGAHAGASRPVGGMRPGRRLLDWASAPSHLQFNKFVLNGYRPVASGGECLRSLFYLHNELGNIYTHGIPLLGFIFLLPLSMPWAQISVSWLGVVHYLACITPQLGSVLYHLFMNHKGGAPVYHTLLTVDMCGVCMVNTLGALPIIYVTLLCYPSTRSVALLTYTGLSSYAIYCAITASSNVTRLRSFAWQAFFRFFVFFLRWAGVGAGHPSSLGSYLVMDGLALLGGTINISRVPERWKPGKFDYWFNSHQIMHVLVVLSIMHLHWGVVADLLWVTTHVCPGD